MDKQSVLTEDYASGDASPSVDSSKFEERLKGAYKEAFEAEKRVEEFAAEQAKQFQKMQERAEKLKALGQEKSSPWRRRLRVYRRYLRHQYNAQPKWLQCMLWPLAVALTVVFALLLNLFIAVGWGAILIQVLIKFVLFGKKIFKASYIIIKAGTRSYYGLIVARHRLQRYKRESFKQKQARSCVTMVRGKYWKNTVLTSQSGQQVTLRHSTLVYGIDGFRIMNLYSMVIIPWNFVSCMVKGVASVFLKSLKPSPEDLKKVQFWKKDFWVWFIGNFKMAYVRIDKPENVGPVYLKKRENALNYIYRELVPKLDVAANPATPKNVEMHLSNNETASDIAISAITAPGVGVALATGDLMTALMLLDTSNMMIGAGGNPDKHGHKIFVVEDDFHYLCIPADMKVTKAYDTPSGMVICAKAGYKRPKMKLSWKFPFVHDYKSVNQSYVWEILVRRR